jgi:hypothetical protein
MMAERDARFDGNGLHYSRFLYRALRFRDAFPWFTVDDRLRARLDDFRYYTSKETLWLAPPEGAASDVPGSLEAAVEYRFSLEANRGYLNGLLGADVPEFHRQLPVGLFRGSAADGNRFFPGGAAAIDLWGIEGRVFHLLEIKAAPCKKVGVLSELFFYACFVRDMFMMAKAGMPDSKFRGYRALKEKRGGLNIVRGCILIPDGDAHPMLEPAFGVLAGSALDGVHFAEVVRYDRAMLGPGPASKKPETGNRKPETGN